MDCPHCLAETNVVETRADRRRRRVCSVCGYRFTTYELLATDLHALQADRAKLEQLVTIISGGPTSDFAETRPAPLDLELPP